MSQLPVLFFAQLITDMLLLIIGVWCFRKASTPLRVLIILFVLHAFVDFFGVYLATTGTENLWLHHVYTPIEFALIMVAFALWQDNKKLRFAMIITAILFCLFCLVVKVTSYESIKQFDSLTSTISRVIMVALALYTIVSLYVNNYTSIFLDSRFWIATGILKYFIGTITIFALGNFFVEMPATDVVLTWSISWGVTSIANMLYAGGLFCPIRQ